MQVAGDPRCYDTLVSPTFKRNTRTTDWANAMSYFFENQGPVVYLGRRHEAFRYCQREFHALDGEARIGRLSFVNTCTGADDQDRDGICDDVDSCIGRADGLAFLDRDGDGISAECDLCDMEADHTGLEDLDGDGVAGLCDADEDGDGCWDGADKDDLSAVMLHYNVVAGATCDGANSQVMVSAGVDVDGDGLASCDPAETDSDGDGIGDQLDPCPLMEGEDCTFVRNCPLIEDFPIDLCFLGACQGFRFEFDDQVNPQLELTSLLRVSDGVLVFAPPESTTASELMRQIEMRIINPGLVNGGSALSNLVGTTVMRIFDPDDALVGEWEVPTNVMPAEFDSRGGLVRLVLPLDEGTVGRLSLVDTPFEDPNFPLQDRDFDGVVDAQDNCVCYANPIRRDQDLDGVGDGCDLDFDSDGVVDGGDVAFVDSCVGFAVYDDSEVVSDEHIRDDSCAIADLDEDGTVTLSDLDRVSAHVGEPAGPSAFAELAGWVCP